MNEATTIYLRWPLPGGKIDLEIVTERPLDTTAWEILATVTASMDYLTQHVSGQLPREDDPTSEVPCTGRLVHDGATCPVHEDDIGVPPHAQE